MSHYGDSIQYLEWLYYGPGQRYLSKDDTSYLFSKADADVTTSTTGVYNAIYGADVWVQANHEANAFGVLPKYAAKKSGWRVTTAEAGSAADGGISETAAIPDTTKPTFLEVSTKPKVVAHTFGVSEMQSALAESGDDTTGDMNAMRKYFGSIHRLRMNQMLLRDVDSTAGDRIESIDRVVSANSEVSLITANDADIYGIDRDAAAGWSDAYVDAGSSGTDRDLTADHLLNALDNTREAGANSTFWMTGTDTYAAIQALFEPQVRYTNPLKEGSFQMGVNGIQTDKGIGIGMTFAMLYGLPLIVSKDVVKDTISRIYLLDTSEAEGFGAPRLGLRMNKPTQYFETGISQGNPFAIDKFADQGVYRTMGELICYRFGVQGKIRDLK